MNKKILMLIDCQFDFISGSLAVNGSEEKMNGLCDFIRENGQMYDQIILTADWHPYTHCSFKENGGEWPSHCVEHTMGASIYQPLINALNDIKSDYLVLTKGDNEEREEYSIFRNEKSKNILEKIVKAFKVEDIDFCGIALDYCVKDSVLDAKRAFPNINMHLYKDFSPCIGDVNETLDNLENNGVHII